MGDARFERPHEHVREAEDRVEAIRSLEDEEVVSALAVASRHRDTCLANVLATEAQNRVGFKTILLDHMGDGVYVLGARGIILAATASRR